MTGIEKFRYACLTLSGFGTAFYVMSLVVRTMPLRIACWVWPGASSRASS